MSSFVALRRLVSVNNSAAPNGLDKSCSTPASSFYEQLPLPPRIQASAGSGAEGPGGASLPTRVRRASKISQVPTMLLKEYTPFYNAYISFSTARMEKHAGFLHP